MSDLPVELAAALERDYPTMPDSQKAHICLTILEPLLAAELAEARAAQRESDAKLVETRKRGSAMIYELQLAAAAIRANVTPADAQYIERVRAEAVAAAYRRCIALITDNRGATELQIARLAQWADERIAQLSQKAGKR